MINRKTFGKQHIYLCLSKESNGKQLNSSVGPAKRDTSGGFTKAKGQTYKLGRILGLYPRIAVYSRVGLV
jgi:hypothetical protein